MVKLKLWESKRGYNSCCHCSFSPLLNVFKKNSEIVEEKRKKNIEKEKKRNENAGRKKSKKKLLIVRYENAGNSQVSLSLSSLLIHFPSPPYFISPSTVASSYIPSLSRCMGSFQTHLPVGHLNEYFKIYCGIIVCQ